MIFFTRIHGRRLTMERTQDSQPGNVMLNRRALLRRAVAAGCGLLLPAALLGCDKKDAGTGAAGEAASPGPDTTGNTSLPPTPGDSSAVGTPSSPGTDSTGAAGTPGTGTPPGDTSGGATGSAPGSGTDAGTGSSTGGSATASGGGGAKASQASVQYQDQPKGAQKCANCIQFIQPDGCKVVAGRISPEGWCVIWVGQT